MKKSTIVKKLLKLNADGSVAVGLPIRLARSLDWNSDTVVSITRAGNTLHITEVKID